MKILVSLHLLGEPSREASLYTVSIKRHMFFRSYGELTLFFALKNRKNRQISD